MTLEEAARIARPRIDAYNLWLSEAVQDAKKRLREIEETRKSAGEFRKTLKGRLGAILGIFPPIEGQKKLHQMFCSCVVHKITAEMYSAGWSGVLLDYVVCKAHATQFRIPDGQYFRFEGKDNSYEDMPEVKGIMNDPNLH